MTQSASGYQSPKAGPDNQSSTQAAREEAMEVGRHAGEAGSQLAQTTTEEAKRVAAETTRQTRDLVHEGVGQIQAQIQNQARESQQRAAEALQGLAGQLRKMAQAGGQSGLAADLVRQGADQVKSMASWLDEREPGDLLNQARTFARRRPGAFLLGAVVLGAVAGRFTRGLVADGSSGGSAQGATAAPGSPGDAPDIPTQLPSRYSETPGAAYAEPPRDIGGGDPAQGYRSAPTRASAPGSSAPGQAPR
jgi:hypothetical protein